MRTISLMAAGLLTLMAGAGMARSDPSNPAANPPHGDLPGAGAARVGILGGTTASGSERLSATVLQATVGLPMLSALRLTLPAVRAGGETDVGSGSAELAASLELHPGRLFTLHAFASVGLVLPGGTEAPATLGDLQLATDDLALRTSGLLQVILRSGVSFAFRITDEPDYPRYGGEIGQVLAGGQLALGLGLTSSFDDDAPPPLASAFLTYRPAWQPDLAASLFASLPLEERVGPTGEPTIGLSMTWDFGFAYGVTRPGSRLLAAPKFSNVTPLVVRAGAHTATDYAVPGRATIIAFEAWWCAPCKEMERLFARAAADHEGLQILTVDAETQRDLYVDSGGTGSLPYTVVLDQDGHEVGRIHGYEPARFDELLAQALRE